MNYKKLSAGEQKTFGLHLTYSIIEGLIRGVLIMNEFVLIKSLAGSNYQIGFLLQFQHVVLIFSVFMNEFLGRTTRKRKMLNSVAILTRLPLFALAFFPATSENIPAIYHIIFLGVFLLYYLSNPIVFPTINLLLKNSYSHNNFGKYYSYATSINKIVMLGATFGFGLWLDHDPYIYRWIYPVLGLLGILSIVLLTRIDYTPKVHPKKLSIWVSVRRSLSRMKRIILNNKPYRDFEIGFMFYGFAFMTSAAVLTIFFERELHLNYTSIATYKNASNILAIMTLPFFGQLLNRVDPRRFAALTFGSLLLFIAFLAATDFWPDWVQFGNITLHYSLSIAYVFYGIFAATMPLMWNIGSAYFAKSQYAGDYQAIHLSLTGLRALFAPLAGVLAYEVVGYFYTFVMGIVALLIGIAIMYYSMWKRKKAVH
ncbi:MAG: MFS transporter [Salinivirgaceae bacterium]|jgi:MFS family permease|nr:MFS transporter [Salinivirgaceae bacterium]